ncbi:MAG: GHMP kinase [Bacteroidales bacterium]|nr:GHMP kinase [Bacteroidales bacterium]
MTFYSNGKFLITGEYLVLHGALSLAVPLGFGQSFEVRAVSRHSQISWKSFVLEKLWFNAEFSIPGFEIISTNDQPKAKFLSDLLVEANSLNPGFLGNSGGLDVVSKANFDISWGLGSSSTLISNIAYWFAINPFDLHFSISQGSGFDIACARSETPVLYQLINNQPTVTPVGFYPPFKDQIYFVYLGKKQRSDKSILQLTDRLISREKEISLISEITGKMVNASDLAGFNHLIDEHERIMANVLNLPPVKEIYFANHQGSVKSLGAWGGDFVMMTWEHGKKSLLDYLKRKGFDTVFGFDEIILHPASYNAEHNY